MEAVRLAIVGCGAIAELGHLPGAQATPEVAVTVLVDRDEAHARALAARFGVPHVATEIAQAAQFAEAAVVALPPHLHRPAAETLFTGGLHVLMEKPLATGVAECDAILAAAERADRVIAVAMMRRFARSARYLKAALGAGMVGRVRRYVARSGVTDAWPSRSPFSFSAAHSGGGALISTGCHDLDLMLWLMGPLDDFTFHSDSLTRMDANCLLEGTLASGAAATIEVSRTRTLANTIRIEGELATLEAPLMGEAVTVIPHGAPRAALPMAPQPPLDFARVMGDQLADFAGAVRGRHAPMTDGVAGRDIIALMEQCYARAEPLILPWNIAVPLGMEA